jgi:hypothetical protein
MKDLHEFISFRFRPGFDREAQFRTMEELHPVMLSQPGLLLREWFYSERDASWVTHMVWADEYSLEAAEPSVENDPHAMELLSRLDPATMHYAKFEKVGSVDTSLVA